MGQEQERRFALGLADLARDLLAQKSVQATLDRIVSGAIELVEGCQDAGIMTVVRGQVHTLAFSSQRARASDELQGELREGPCWDAVRGSEQVLRIGDLSALADRWPRYTARARELGIGSTISFLLFTDDQELGALNLYSSAPGVLGEEAEHTGWVLASHAAVALATARSDTHLHAAVDTRQRIGQAVGILIERHKLTPDQAFHLLARCSQHRNVKLRDLADHLVTTGELLT